MDGYLKETGAFPNFSQRNREKMCTCGIELKNIHLPSTFNCLFLHSFVQLARSFAVSNNLADEYINNKYLH